VVLKCWAWESTLPDFQKRILVGFLQKFFATIPEHGLGKSLLLVHPLGNILFDLYEAMVFIVGGLVQELRNNM
jgi:hypothetical protein